MIIVLQTALGIVTAVLWFDLLRRLLKVAFWPSAVVAVLVALDPAALFYERMVMAESAGLLCLTLFVWLLVDYTLKGKAWLLPLIAACGILTVGFRFNLLPVILVLSVIGPLIQIWQSPAGAPQLNERTYPCRRWLFHLAVACVATLAVHQGYQQLYGHLVNTRPDYHSHTGRFKLGLVMPMVRPRHMLAAGADPTLLEELEFPRTDVHARNPHLWMKGGMIRLVNTHYDNPDEIAGKIASAALKEKPWRLLRMGIRTQLGHFDPDVRGNRLKHDLARWRKIPPGMAETLDESFNYDADKDWPGPKKPFDYYFELGSYWLTACMLITPLAGLFLLVRPGRYGAAGAVIGLLALGLSSSYLLFSHIISFRYLQSFPPVLFACIALLLTRDSTRFKNVT